MQGKKRNPHEMAPREWYGTAVWKRLARAQIRREPYCVLCLAAGRPVLATSADHKFGFSDWNSFILGKLQSLCSSCSSARHPSTGTEPKVWFGEDGNPLGDRDR
jgi:hypothetical protein